MSKKQPVRPKQAKQAKKAKLQTNLMPPFTENCKNIVQSKAAGIKNESPNTCSDDSSDGSLFDEEQDYLNDVSTLPDCRFIVGPQNDENSCKVFYGHRMVLSSKSLLGNFFCGTMPLYPSQFRVFNFDSDTFSRILRFIYTDHIELFDLDMKELKALSLAADEYMVTDLKDLALETIGLKTTVDCVWETFHLAEMMHSNELWDACLLVVQCKSSEALASPGLVESTLAQLMAVLRSDELTVTSELEVIEACLRWVRRQCEQLGLGSEDNVMEPVLRPDLLLNLRLLTLTPEEFAQGPASQGWLTEAEKLSIFMYICTKDSKWFYDTLCTNTELRRRPENIPRKYELVLSNADTSFKHHPDKKEISTYFYIDNIIYLNGVTIYSQIDHEDVISKSDLVIDPQAMKEGYIENVRVKLRNQDRQIIGINCTKRVAYNSSLQIVFPEPIKLDQLYTDNKKNRYQLIILFRESGWYPMHKYPKLLRSQFCEFKFYNAHLGPIKSLNISCQI